MPITTTPSGGPQGEFSTYTPIYAQTLSSAAASITFSNIPTTFTDLVLVMSPATTHTLATFPYMRFNGDSGSNYSYTEVNGNGSSATSFRDTNQTIGWTSPQMGSISNTLGDNKTIVNIMNYSNTTTNKTYLSRANRAGSTLDYQGVDAAVGLWRNTAPITSVFVGNRRGGVDYNFSSGSTFTLYGIKAAIPAPKATGGDVITTDGTYWYHAFRSTGSFNLTPAVSSLTADILQIAGGGGGGANVGAGAGAGGISYLSNQSLTLQTYTCLVGGGGASITRNIVSTGNMGSNSRFGSLTAAVGGGGGGGNGGGSEYTGGTGGSGGGSGEGANQGSGTIGQGNNGGTANDNPPNYGSGGGGGAGAVGGNGTSSAGGAGGAGVNTYSSWALATATGVSGFYAGGGGGATFGGGTPGSGGSGGGGAGGSFTDGSGYVGVSGTTNTGGGGGGMGGNSVIPVFGSGAGGSGLVIVRYPV
jgi:hypothetical protein